MRRTICLAAALILAVVAGACAAAPTASSLLPVDTAVALTIQAITAAVTAPPTETPAPLPTSAPQVLPHTVYFLNRDAAGLWQVYRLAVDGQTVQQVTFEPVNVDVFDVSPADGSLAYITNNQLYLVDSVGAGRRLLVDGGPLDDNNRWINSIVSPVWSRDGQTLAFSHGGLTFLNLGTGAENKVLINQIDTSAGFPIVRELYSPNAWSPDGSRLLINIGFYEGGTYGVFTPSNNALVRFQRPEGGIVCCYVDWIPDSSGVYITSPSLGMVDAGLFHADAVTGTVTALLPGSAPDGTYNFAFAAHVGSDNKLYFFFNNLSEIPTGGHTPFHLVRADPDGSTNRTQVVSELFENINEVLWAPDASLAVVVAPADPNEFSGGAARLVYLDGRPGANLLDYARGLRWGP